MRDSSLSALFGALSNETRMASIANNLANVNTTAYKKDTMAFHDVFARFAHDHVVTTKSYLRDKDMFPDPDIMAKPRLSEQIIDFTQGSMQNTGNQLDFALAGEGLFRVQAPEGVLYTRSGNFLIDSAGTLVTQQGLPVMVDGGSFTVPVGAKVDVNPDGNIFVNGQLSGSFDVTSFENIERLERVGGNMYRAPEGMNEVEPQDVKIRQGFIEKSNVEVVTEMVSMIESQRSFTMYTKMIQNTDAMDKNLIQKLSRITG